MSNFYAGLAAGLISNFICNPFDVIRTHKQLNKKITYNPLFLYRGILIGSITIPTFWSTYFGTYEYFKQFNQTKLYFLNGYFAANIASIITCPLWFIRQKFQIQPNFNIFNYYIKYGTSPFYNALIPTFIINSSFIIQIPMYEYLKKILQKNNTTFNIFCITAISKTIATCFFYPMDTIRTIKRNNDNINFLTIIKTLNRNPINYYLGISTYLIRSIPYHATTFCAYEYFKKK